MMTVLKPGDQVWIVEREPTPDDEKNGLYYAYFANLAGKVDRVYDEGTVCVDVNIDSLPENVRRRHEATERAAKARWLDGLSGEARNRLTEDEKQFTLSYKVLVSAKDLKLGKAGAAGLPAALQTKTKTPKASGGSTIADLKPSAQATKKEKTAAPQAQRLTQKDLDKAEQEFLAKKMAQTPKAVGDRKSSKK